MSIFHEPCLQAPTRDHQSFLTVNDGFWLSSNFSEEGLDEGSTGDVTDEELLGEMDEPGIITPAVIERWMLEVVNDHQTTTSSVQPSTTVPIQPSINSSMMPATVSPMNLVDEPSETPVMQSIEVDPAYQSSGYDGDTEQDSTEHREVIAAYHTRKLASAISSARSTAAVAATYYTNPNLTAYQNPDKYVIWKKYRLSTSCKRRRDEVIGVETVEESIKIDTLRSYDQDRIYHAAIQKAPLSKVAEYYRLNLDRLRSVRANISAQKREFKAAKELERVATTGGFWERDARQQDEEYEVASKADRRAGRASHSKMTSMSDERGVIGLLEKCEEMLKMDDSCKLESWWRASSNRKRWADGTRGWLGLRPESVRDDGEGIRKFNKRRGIGARARSDRRERALRKRIFSELIREQRKEEMR
ncbi:hypothetical protein MMC28_010860 [Mycoblastus sanguinarius]|nr:hypothetical protein [Mycoblastus sanguinarius]